MTTARKIFWFVCMLSVCLATGCRKVLVHEFPDEEAVDPTLINLSLKITPCPEYTFQDDVVSEVYTDEYYPEQESAVRFILQLRVDESFNKEVIYSEEIITTPEHLNDVIERSFELHALHYKVLVWQDLTDPTQPSLDRWFYASSLTAIKVMEKDIYVGGYDSKQVSAAGESIDLSGYADQWNIDLEVEVPMIRPQSKYIIISNDLKKFVKAYMANYPTKGEVTASEIFDICHMKVRYNGYVPTGYNIYSGLLNDSQGSYSYDFNVQVISETEAIVAFDYVLTGPTDTSVSLALELTDEEGAVLKSVSSVTVPLSRNRITVVRGEYLTREYGGGVGIDSDFDGEINVYI